MNHDTKNKHSKSSLYLRESCTSDQVAQVEEIQQQLAETKEKFEQLTQLKTELIV